MSTITADKSYDVQAIRSDFPILDREMRNKPMVFLDSAASSQKPDAVVKAMVYYYQQQHANVHRGVYQLSQEATDAYEKARHLVQGFINAPSEKEVLFVRGTTEGINLVASSYGRKFLQEGDEVIISAMEHHSNIVPWQLICEQTGAKLRVIPVTDEGELVMEEYEQMLNDRTKIVAVVHISNTLGTINPVERIIELAHAKDIPVLLDGAQAIPHLKVDVQALDVDFYTFSGHKMFGPTGIGILYGKEKWLNAMPPYQGGGEMIETVSFEKTTFNELPHKFEAGTPDIAGAVGLGAAVEYMEQIGHEAIQKHEHDLLVYGMEALGKIPGVRLIGTAKDKASVISFLLDGAHPYDVGTLLDQMGIAVRTGHHCTQPLMDLYGIPGTVRASFAIYNTKEDIDRLVEGVQRAAKNVGIDMNINEIQEEIIDEFSFFGDWMEKYEYIIDLGKSLPQIEEQYKDEDHIIKGCQSRVWLHAEPKGDQIEFTADSDAIITKGLIALLIRVLSAQKAADIAEADLYFIDKIGLKEHLSPTRSNGLVSMVKQMKLYGLAIQAKNAN